MNFYKLWYITIHCIFFILCFPIRIHVKKLKIESEIISKLANQFRLNFEEGFSIAERSMPQNFLSFCLF